MKLGGSYRLREIPRCHWEACARDLRLPAQALIARAEALIAHMSDALPAVAHALHEEGIVDPMIGKLVEGIETHARACRERLGKPAA